MPKRLIKQLKLKKNKQLETEETGDFWVRDRVTIQQMMDGSDVMIVSMLLYKSEEAYNRGAPQMGKMEIKTTSSEAINSAINKEIKKDLFFSDAEEKGGEEE